MENYISVEQVIKQAQNEGIDFGKGDPYNRLRYYTKIGWLPHMTRMANKKGKTVGHYPDWVIERLKKIDEMKDEGLSNDEITQSLKSLDTKRTLSSTLKSENFRNKLAIYVPIIAVLLILIIELGILPIGRSKADLVSQTLDNSTTQNIDGIIIDSGRQLVPQNSSQQVFVESTQVTSNSKIHITFETDYAPASRYWVAYVVPGNGFFVELDTPVAREAQFNWWVTE